jgi:FkbH-like protein
MGTVGESGFRNAISQAKAAAGQGKHAAALAGLRACVRPDQAFVDQARVAAVLDAIDLSSLGLRPLRIALVAGSTMDHFSRLLRFWLADAGISAEILITPFDTAAQSVLDPSSALYGWRPDVVWLFTTQRDISIQLAPNASSEGIAEAVAEAVAGRRALWQILRERSGCLVIDNTADTLADDPFGNLAGAAPWGRRALLRRYNTELVCLPPGVVIFDLDHVAGMLGRRLWHDPRYWFHSRHAFALDASGPIAHAAARLIAGALGLAKKCLVVDLDNTLWGGVIGDDGLAGIALGAGNDGEAFKAFQHFIKALRDRGIILAACSKNDPEIAASVFRDHPDCVLKLDDFAVFVANWNNKADNIRDIAATLNIGLDAIAFVDDNPMERDIVRRNLPEVAVLELPDDPAGFVGALARSGWFEAIRFSTEDVARNRYYQENAQRAASRSRFVDMDGYLADLAMVGTLGAADPLQLPRLAQLINKSNQFHLTGTRYSETELLAIAARPGWIVRHLRLQDRFGDNGLIAGVVLNRVDDTLHVDTWVMSCRVLGRTVEEFIANEILSVALAEGCSWLAGRYVSSRKNGLVADLFGRLGFTCTGETDTGTDWRLAVHCRPAGWKTWVRVVPGRPLGEASSAEVRSSHGPQPSLQLT